MVIAINLGLEIIWVLIFFNKIKMFWEIKL